MALQLEGLDLLGTQATPGDGQPMLLAIDTIDEDPGQPRQEFDEEPLCELAETIRARGVRQPISVRPNPAAPGRWLLNFGARRLRASKLAGKTHVPAFVDLSVDSYDQVIENEQRERLKPLELALFIERRLAAGESQIDIARRMGKSKAYVTYAMALIDAPEWLLAAYREGRCRGLRELYELRRADSAPGFDAEAWTNAQPSITRRDLRTLGVAAPVSDAAVRARPEPPVADPAPRRSSGTDEHRSRRPRVQAMMAGDWVDVRLDRLPDERQHAFVKRAAEQEWASIPLADLNTLRLVID